jgi:glycosyltransferase involved in cell wall biosynthesis
VTSISLRPVEPVIGIDASRLSISQRTGTETYTWETLRAMAALHEPDAIRLYLNATTPPPEVDVGWEMRSVPFPRFWTHARLSAEMALHPPKMLWVPAHVIPVNHPRTVVTVHDLGYLHVLEGHSRRQRRMLDLTTRWSARAATHIIAISETTKRDLTDLYGVDGSKISVIPHGVKRETTPPEKVESTLERLRIDRPFILAVGTVQPRKNYDGLARALGAVKTAGLPHRLVIAGKKGWLAESVDRAIVATGNADRVTQLGYVGDEDLGALYAAADLVAFPSWYEGFGLPALEAMQAGAPVLVSNRGALPEIAGDAAWIIDPGDEASFGATLISALTDSERRAVRIARGRERARSYSWEATARQTFELLRSIRDR